MKVEPEREQRYSFYSGHTSLAFSLAVSAGTVARLRGYRAEPVIWATGLSLAGATAYLRIAADAHYTSDVLTGAALGSLAGILVPLLVHGDVLGERATIIPGGRGARARRWSGSSELGRAPLNSAAFPPRVHGHRGLVTLPPTGRTAGNSSCRAAQPAETARGRRGTRLA